MIRSLAEVIKKKRVAGRVAVSKSRLTGPDTERVSVVGDLGKPVYRNESDNDKDLLIRSSNKSTRVNGEDESNSLVVRLEGADKKPTQFDPSEIGMPFVPDD